MARSCARKTTSPASPAFKARAVRSPVVNPCTKSCSATELTHLGGRDDEANRQGSRDRIELDISEQLGNGRPGRPSVGGAARVETRVNRPGAPAQTSPA